MPKRDWKDIADLAFTIVLIIVPLLIYLGIAMGRNMWLFVWIFWLAVSCHNLLNFYRRPKN